MACLQIIDGGEAMESEAQKQVWAQVEVWGSPEKLMTYFENNYQKFVSCYRVDLFNLLPFLRAI